jgi:hypothetical protein
VLAGPFPVLGPATLTNPSLRERLQWSSTRAAIGFCLLRSDGAANTRVAIDSDCDLIARKAVSRVLQCLWKTRGNNGNGNGNTTRLQRTQGRVRSTKGMSNTCITAASCVRNDATAKMRACAMMRMIAWSA